MSQRETLSFYSAGYYVIQYRMYSITAHFPWAVNMLAVTCLHPPVDLQ